MLLINLYQTVFPCELCPLINNYSKMNSIPLEIDLLWTTTLSLLLFCFLLLTWNQTIRYRETSVQSLDLNRYMCPLRFLFASWNKFVWSFLFLCGLSYFFFLFVSCQFVPICFTFRDLLATLPVRFIALCVCHFFASNHFVCHCTHCKTLLFLCDQPVTSKLSSLFFVVVCSRKPILTTPCLPTHPVLNLTLCWLHCDIV